MTGPNGATSSGARPRPGRAPGGVVVHVADLRKTFPARGRNSPAVTAVDGVGFQVGRGELIGLLGPNGAGKTTTIKALCGLIRPDEGELRVCGVDVRRRRRAALRHLTAVLEGNRNLYWRLTVRENLEYFAGNRGVRRARVQGLIDTMLERFSLTDRRDAQVSDLSRGMQQKLALAVAAMADTEVLLLDEPTLGLDVETGYEVRALLRELRDQGRTVIVSTHDMPVVQDLCERTVVIAHGRVLADDRVDHLLRLFASRAYELQLGSPLSGSQLEALRRRFPAATVTHDAMQVHIDLLDGHELYALIDVLRAERTPIESIDRRVIDFETVFRRLVKGEASGPNGAREHAAVRT
jgi:ABC-2 type transport system ATP-binding protein